MKPLRPSPYFLLVLTTLFWSSNFVLARAVHLEVPPIGLSFWRWALAGLLLLPFIWREMVARWSLVRRHLPLVTALALLSVSSFNTLVYLGLQTTTASNGVLLQSIIPLVIILLSRLILGVLVTAGQGLGILASLLGVLIIITRGDLQVLLQFAITRGDLLVLAAVVAWGFYSTLLKKLPVELRGLPLLGYTIAIGVLGIAPLYAWEIAQGGRMTLNALTLGSVGYVAIFPSLLAYLFWNRAVEQLGPNRSGQFIHLMPVFGSLLSVLFLSERLHLYHLVGILFVAAGIYIANLRSAFSQ